MLLGFFDRAIGEWPAALLFSVVGPSRHRSNHQGSEPLGIKLSEVKLSWVGIIVSQAIVSQAIAGETIASQLLLVEPLAVQRQ